MTQEEWRNLKVGDVLIRDRTLLRKVMEVIGNPDHTIKLTWSSGLHMPIVGSGGVSNISFCDKYELYFKKVKNTALARKMYPEGEVEGEYLKVKLV